MGFIIKLKNSKPNTEKIGTPSDSSWRDGFFNNWTQNTDLADALDDISEAFLEMAPDMADVLTGKNLTRSITVYEAKLPSGLDEKWYVNAQPGDVISEYTVNTEFTANLPSEGFRCGRFKDPSTYGVLQLILNGEVINEYDMSQGVGTNGTFNVTAIEKFNRIWTKAVARFTTRLLDEGFSTYKVFHSEAGETNAINFYFDNSPGNLAFSEPLIAVIVEENNKYLSGIKYLTTGTVINVQGSAASGIFKKAYHKTHVAKITGTALEDVIKNPSGIPNMDDNFSIDEDIVLNKGNQSSDTLVMQLTFFKPHTSIQQTVILDEPVCTYGIVSTVTAEQFFDEDKRLVLNTNTKWNSANPLENGNAQVRNGFLVYGDTDYPDKTGPQEYQRKFYKVSASTGYIEFSGINYHDISPYGQGDLNVLIKLDNDNKFFDLGRAVGDKNGDGSGSNRENSIGARINGSGNRINWSLGTYNTAYNSNEYRIIIIFRTNRFAITGITTG
mgnify:FL=1